MIHINRISIIVDHDNRIVSTTSSMVTFQIDVGSELVIAVVSESSCWSGRLDNGWE